MENFSLQEQPGDSAQDACALARDEDLRFCVYSACSMLSLYDYSVDAAFMPFRSLKAQIELDRFSKKIFLRASDGFAAAPRDVLVGMAVSLLSRVLRRKIENAYTSAYGEFMKRKSTFDLNKSIRLRRAIRRKNSGEGAHFDLNALLLKVASEHEIFFPEGVPSIAWSRNKSRRRLGFYDEALNQVVLTRLFDSPKVPQFVVEYVVFHELLHAKHEAKYERGKTRQCRVHHGEFKRDEKSFPKYAEAEEWLENNLRHLR